MLARTCVFCFVPGIATGKSASRSDEGHALCNILTVLVRN